MAQAEDAGAGQRFIASPITTRVYNLGLDEFFAGTCERIGDLGRRRMRDLTTDDAVRFELAELGGQDFFADTGKELAKFGETFRTEAQMPDG